MLVPSLCTCHPSTQNAHLPAGFCHSSPSTHPFLRLPWALGRMIFFLFQVNIKLCNPYKTFYLALSYGQSYLPAGLLVPKSRIQIFNSSIQICPIKSVTTEWLGAVRELLHKARPGSSGKCLLFFFFIDVTLKNRTYSHKSKCQKGQREALSSQSLHVPLLKQSLEKRNMETLEKTWIWILVLFLAWNV